jgi:hypothetical protein
MVKLVVELFATNPLRFFIFASFSSYFCVSTTPWAYAAEVYV